MAQIVNLRTARKRKAKAEEAAVAEQNRITFGRTKAERLQTQAEQAQAKAQLDGHERQD